MIGGNQATTIGGSQTYVGRIAAHPDLAASIVICVVLGLAFIASTTLVVAGKTYFTLHDDIMISMTYARNLAEGHGLVWTPGEPPVEGFTNPLWVAYLSLLHLVSPVDRYVTLLVALSALGLLVVGLFGVNTLARRLGATDAGRLFALLTAASLYAPAFWSLHGFEVSLLIALDTWMLILALDRSRPGLQVAVWLGCMGAVAMLTRLDSVLVTGSIIALRFLRPSWAAIREMFVAGLIILAAGVVMEAARYAYYGDLLPNTAYLKLSNLSIWNRIRAGIAADYHAAIRWLPIGLLAFVPAVVMAASRRVSERGLAYLGVLGVIAVQFAYCAYVGGDAWEWSGFPNRYLSIVSFALCACAGVGAGVVVERLPLSNVSPRAVAAVAALVGFAWTSLGDWSDTVQGRGFQWVSEKNSVRAGIALRAGTPPGFRYALTWAGAVPYYAEGRNPVDLLGKMDPVIARMKPEGKFKPGHNKHDLDHSLGVLRPDAMIHLPAPLNAETIKKLDGWGYVRTPGGWWILKTSKDKVDPALLDKSFNF